MDPDASGCWHFVIVNQGQFSLEFRRLGDRELVRTARNCLLLVFERVADDGSSYEQLAEDAVLGDCIAYKYHSSKICRYY